jgi:hypothetical protein
VRVAVIAGVCRSTSADREGSKELRRHGRVATLARHRREVVRPALAVEDREELRDAAAALVADRRFRALAVVGSIRLQLLAERGEFSTAYRRALRRLAVREKAAGEALASGRSQDL